MKGEREGERGRERESESEKKGKTTVKQKERDITIWGKTRTDIAEPIQTERKKKE